MCAAMRAIYAGARQGTVYQTFYDNPVNLMNGSDYSDEQRSCRQRRSLMRHIGNDGVAYFLSQGQQFKSAAFPMDPDMTLTPVEIVKRQARDLAGTQPETGQQQDDGPIPEILFAIARIDNALNVRVRKKSRDGGQPPVC
ncbi:hypothetical protein Amme_300_002 [Acidomonas methanolica NBRC 104435]|uniref:Uncharacterized protein n=1 Tax=Acidomonas methanolica NBRC 104435 TaxID=1231351 RepID=A0A023DAK9_ACIMT|nr:hypothetical protein Amme_300_002 [Acidomonas methanolica NBRC 104435]GEL00786.1 hypothetical protein AME01nite_32840 [Acidomonas methanolica NBRC 104435]